VQIAPAPPFWKDQEAYDKILGVLWRINLAGLIAYLCGEFFNSYVLAKLKVKTAESLSASSVVNKGMASRFILSTVVGQFFDSGIFVICAFGGTVPVKVLGTMFLSSWGVKVFWEAIALPITIPVVKWIKRKEHMDALDRNTDFNPLHFR
jgi:queuosine precursor transporter